MARRPAARTARPVNPVKLSSKLPKELRLNGLDTIHGKLSTFGDGYVIAYVAAHEVVNRLGDKQPIITIEHIEGVPEHLVERAAGLLDEARRQRETDGGVLPGL